MEHRHAIRSHEMFCRTLIAVMSEKGSSATTKALGDMVRKDSTLSNEMVPQFLELLVEAGVLIPVEVRRRRDQEALTNRRRYYASDMGIKAVFSEEDAVLRPDWMENAVVLELIGAGYDISVIDVLDGDWYIMATLNEIKLYVKVCRRVSTMEEFKAETKRIRAIHDQFPKFLIASEYCEFNGGKIADVRCCDLRGFMDSGYLPNSIRGRYE